jgi:hypothetical protein
VSQLLKFFDLGNVNVELSETVKDEFAFVDEDVDFVL